MDHFLFSKVCHECKKSLKTYKIFLSYYDDTGRFILSKEEAADIFSFTCQFCNSLNVVEFDEISNPFTICYLRRENEINRQVEEINDNLLRLKIMKLKITT